MCIQERERKPHAFLCFQIFEQSRLADKYLTTLALTSSILCMEYSVVVSDTAFSLTKGYCSVNHFVHLLKKQNGATTQGKTLYYSSVSCSIPPL